MDLREIGIAQRLGVGFGIAAAAVLATSVFGGAYALVAFDGIDGPMGEAARELAQALLAFGIAAVLVVAMVAWLSIRTITGPLRQGIAAARSAAAGDLAAPIEVSGRDEAAELLAALHTLCGSVAAVVARAREGMESIAQGSSEVAAGAASLATRTEDEASTLAQAASTLEQFTATVQQNAQHAGNASRLADETSKIAQEGSKVVERVVTAMDDIASSSRRIADIVAVIDDIAFQTRLLALNAAVEAARAGEQGRGFAVVAAEVRSLAQRSADSAREIRTLIGSSRGKMETGSREARAAGEAMDDILTSINLVSHVMSDIAAAGREQSAGIGQINLAVSRLDSATQANASLAGETTSAARRMKSDAEALSGTLSHFRTAGASRP